MLGAGYGACVLVLGVRAGVGEPGEPSALLAGARLSRGAGVGVGACVVVIRGMRRFGSAGEGRGVGGGKLVGLAEVQRDGGGMEGDFLLKRADVWIGFVAWTSVGMLGGMCRRVVGKLGVLIQCGRAGRGPVRGKALLADGGNDGFRAHVVRYTIQNSN